MKGWAEKLAQGWLPSVPPPGYKTVVYHGQEDTCSRPADNGNHEARLQVIYEPQSFDCFNLR